MLRPKDVFVTQETFVDWWFNVINNHTQDPLLLWYWNTPCVPGSYGIDIR